MEAAVSHGSVVGRRFGEQDVHPQVGVSASVHGLRLAIIALRLSATRSTRLGEVDRRIGGRGLCTVPQAGPGKSLPQQI